NLQDSGRGVRLPGVHVRTNVFSENRPGSPGTAAIEENHRAGGKVEPHASRVGELLLSRHRQSGVSGARQLCGCAVASVVAFQAQDQTKQGRQLSTLAPLRDLWTRASDPAGARRAVGEGVRSCPRAGCWEIRMSGSMRGMWKRSYWSSY